MTARTTHYVHADGTVSTRTSKTRVYGWAVEQIRDLHVEAAAKAAHIVKLETELESFERGVAAKKVIRSSKPWPRGERYQDFYVEDPTSGERHWIGSQVVDADGKVVRGEEFDAKAAVKESRRLKEGAIERMRSEAQELAAGPQHAYAIVRWSERADSAFKAVNSFGYHTGATYRVVEAVEGKPAPVQPAPVAEEAPQEEAGEQGAPRGTRVLVDLVTPTKGSVTVEGTELGGWVLNTARRGGEVGEGWHAEGVHGAVVASRKWGARKAAIALARALGVRGPVEVVVDEEYRRTGERDDF